MPPKKPPPQAPKKEVQHCGVFLEGVALPVWDDQEVEREPWGDLNTTHAVDPAQLFTDPDAPAPHIAGFSDVAGLDWRRPANIFSPFKPVVFRPAQPGNPYAYDPAAVVVGDEDDAAPISREAMLQSYRRPRVFRVDEAAPARGRTGQGRRREQQQLQLQQMAVFMKAFNSALMALYKNNTAVPAGCYAWELIHPQAPQAPHCPVYNPSGRYCVKLWVGGAWRKVTVDDRLPVDSFGQCVLTVTEQREVWPALLAKAMLKVLGPQHEECFFRCPLLLLQMLLGGWVGQRIDPLREETLAMRTVRQVLLERTAQHTTAIVAPKPSRPATADPKEAKLDKTDKGGKEDKGKDDKGEKEKPAEPVPEVPAVDPLLLLATVEDTTDPFLADEALAASAKEAGLPMGQAYAVLGAKVFDNTTLVHLCGPYAKWSGQCSYGSDFWGEEVCEELGVDPDSRDPADAERRWHDLWLPWEAFVRHFRSLHALRCASDLRRFPFAKQIHYVPDLPPQDPAPAKGKGAPPPRPISPTKARPKPADKWLCFASDKPTAVLLCVSGLPPTARGLVSAPAPVAATPRSVSPTEEEPEPAPTSQGVTVESFDWRRSEPFVAVLRRSALAGVGVCAMLPVPAGRHAFRVTAEGLLPGVALSVLSAVEFAMGEERDIRRDHVGVHTTEDAGVVDEHRPEATTVWFKRVLTVKQPTVANLVLGTLPKGTDLALHRSVAIDAPPAKGKAEKAKAAKNAPPPPAENVDATIDDEPYPTPLLHHARLQLIDLDDGSERCCTVSKIMGATLAPNKSGYLLFASGRTPEPRGRAYWHLTCTSDRPLETFEPRAFEEQIKRTGTYAQNDSYLLFKHNFTAAEAATCAVQVTVSHGIPFRLALLLNDKEIDARSSAGDRAMLEHCALVPSEKGSQQNFSLVCTVDPPRADRWEADRTAAVVAQFRSESAAQAAALAQHATALGEQLQAGQTVAREDGVVAAGPGDDAAAAPAGVEPIRYELTLHSSAARIDMKEDTAAEEVLAATRAAWPKRDEAPPQATQSAQGQKKPPTGKGAPQVDEAALRTQKAKDARRRFLANRSWTFLPYSDAEGKPVLDGAAEPAMRRVQPTALGEHCSAGRMHGGVSAGGAVLHGGVTAAAPPPSERPRPDSAALLERCKAVTVDIRDARKAVYDHLAESYAAFFADLLPETPAAPPPVEEDSKVGRKKGKK